MSSQTLPPMQPQPIDQPSPAAVFDLGSDEARIAYMRAQGAKNIDPPLPRSSHLRVKKTGIIYPWIEMLAIQTDIMECCDANGNTDPAAWGPTVVQDDYDADEHQIEMLKARAAILGQAAKTAPNYQVEDAVSLQPKPMGYPEGVVPAYEIDKLLQMLES